MRPEMFGDSYDFLKKTLIQTLAEDWMTHPMYFDAQPEIGFPLAHAEYLGARLAAGNRIDRDKVEHVGMHCPGHLILDPDTGVWTGQRRPNGGWNKHLRLQEVARIASAQGRDDLLTLVFDQSYTRATQERRSELALDKLTALQDHHGQCQHQPPCPPDRPLHGAAYVTHAVFIWVSLNGDLVTQATGRMLRRTQLPRCRVVPRQPADQDAE